MLEIKKMRLPTCEEWDRLVDITNGDDNWMHWNDMHSWCQDVASVLASRRAVRGWVSARRRNDRYATTRNAHLGFRPVVEILNPDPLTPDGTIVTVGTLYMDSKPVKVPQSPTRNGDIPDYIPGAKLEMREALNDPSYQVQAIKAGDVLIADRVLLKNISWDDIAETIETAEPITTRVSSVLEQLLKENAENLADPGDVYAQGYHDAIVDAMKMLGFSIDEKYFD
jgi:hypothetical protein